MLLLLSLLNTLLNAMLYTAGLYLSNIALEVSLSEKDNTIEQLQSQAKALQTQLIMMEAAHAADMESMTQQVTKQAGEMAAKEAHLRCETSSCKSVIDCCFGCFSLECNQNCQTTNLVMTGALSYGGAEGVIDNNKQLGHRHAPGPCAATTLYTCLTTLIQRLQPLSSRPHTRPASMLDNTVYSCCVLNASSL